MTDFVSVPCDGCTACCRSPYLYVRLTEDESDRLRNIDGILEKKPDGSCYYLVDNLCTIYDERPYRCRMYDCRPFGGRKIVELMMRK